MRNCRFAWWFTLSLLSVTITYLAIAVVGDPRREFGYGILPSVVWDSRWDKLQLFAAFHRTGPVDGIVLGSSRAMTVSPSLLVARTNLRFFNLAVDSARAEDDLAVFRWVRGQGAWPKAVLVGLDVEALHDAEDTDPRLTRNGELIRYLPSSASLSARLPVLAAAVSHAFASDYAYDLLRSCRATFRKPTPTMRFDSDGLLHYLQYEHDVALGKFDLATHIDSSQEEYRRRFARMTDLSASRRQCLEELIQECGAIHAYVVVWITPIHPSVAEQLSRRTRYPELLTKTQAYLKRLQSRYGIVVLDLSSPGSFAANESGWVDGGHVDASNADLITLRLAAELRSHGL